MSSSACSGGFPQFGGAGSIPSASIFASSSSSVIQWRPWYSWSTRLYESGMTVNIEMAQWFVYERRAYLGVVTEVASAWWGV